ncbi:MAG: hypothetical protein KJ600_02245 [Nanoarchaeota archaeon]|nr:hypothetical protein [Nanoarchaeota archaeon]MBU1103355.1 hypothetical protein [Nanoarchaeota archaeon]
MNNKASSLVRSNLAYLILLVIVLLPFAVFAGNQMNGASIWSKYYAKEISRVINLAEPGDIISLDVHKATKIAKSNGITRLRKEVFTFDNANKEVCVKLSPGRETCYSYFNDVDVINEDIELGVSKNAGNILVFEIKESTR